MAGKILGSVLIVAACFCMGYRLSIKEKLRLEELVYFKAAITKILSELEHSRSTFCEALTSANADGNDILSSVYNAVKNNNSVKTAWKYAFEENANDCYMTREDIERIAAMGEGFNSSDIDLQKKYAADCIEYINSQEKIIAEKFERDKKVYRSVSVSVGLFIVLLLL